MHLRPYQAAAKGAVHAEWARGVRATVIVAATGAGKAQPLTANILTPSGWTTMREITPGSLVIGSDGKPHRVRSVFPQGKLDTFCVRFSDGTIVECCADHLWAVQTKSQKNRGSGFIVRPLYELIGDLHSGRGTRKWFVPTVAPVEFASQGVPLDPYVLGGLLGDGQLHQVSDPNTGGSQVSYVRFATADSFVVAELERRLNGIANTKHLSRYDYAITSGRTGRRGSPVGNALRWLELMGRRAHEKRIPPPYLYNSVEVRLQLLRGLMVSDGGTPSRGRAPDFSTTSLQLAENVCELVRSLGGVARVRCKAPGVYTHNGERRVGRLSYRVTVSISANPFLLPRKADAYNAEPQQGRTKAIVAIEPATAQECQCILIDSSDHLYVTDGYTVTHNTNIFLDLLVGPDGVLRGGGRGLILAHREELIAQPLQRIADLFPDWSARTGVVKAARNDCEAPLVVGMVQTLANPSRLAQLLLAGPIDYLVTDECHHAVSGSYTGIFAALFAANPSMRHLGVTATPFRADGVGLGQVYESVAARITIRDLVPEYLVPPRWLGINTGISLKGVDTRQGEFVQSQIGPVYETDNCLDLVAATHVKYARGRKSLAFTASVDGAYRLAARFRARGIRADAADGSTPDEVRANVLALLRSGGVEVACNANLWSEGLDVPEVSCIHVVTPCGSDARYTQIVGRGLRPFPGKKDCLILDYLPVDPRNICMMGDVLGVPAKVTVNMRAAVGEVAGGFTFDGRIRGLRGDPLELLARDLRYLDASPFRWNQQHGWSMLGLGRNALGEERTLVLTAPEHDTAQRLLLLTRKGRTSVRVLAEGDIAALAETAQTYAEAHGEGSLIEKSRRWLKQPASAAQLDWLMRLATQRELADQIAPGAALSKGQAAHLITFHLARQALVRAGYKDPCSSV